MNANSARTASGPPPRLPAWIGHLVLAAIVLIVFGQTLTFDYVGFDDVDYVRDRDRIHAGLTLENIGWSITTLSKANYHPLTWLSYMADVTFLGLGSGEFHFTNTLLHLINTLLLFELFSRMTGDRWRSFLISALFGVHPLHVESVAWISERKDMLSTLFALIAIWAYVNWVQHKRLSSWWLLLCGMLFSLLAKQTMVTLPCVLILLDIWPLKRLSLQSPGADAGSTNVASATWIEVFREKWSLFLLSFVFSLAVVYAQAHSGAVVSTEKISLPIRIGNAVLSYGMYLRQTIWPLDLAFYYPHPKDALSWTAVALSAIVLLVVTGICWKERRRNPAGLVGWLWFLGTLLPMIGIIQVGGQARADRYTYVPLIGIFILLAWCIPDVWMARQRLRRVLAGTCVAVLVLLMVQGYRQTATWKDTFTLTEHALAINPDNDVAQSQRGYVLLGAGDLDAAEYHSLRAIELNPERRVESFYNLGIVEIRRGNPSAAVNWFRQGISYKPNYLDARRGLITALISLKQFETAEQEVEVALEQYPDVAEVWFLKGCLHIEAEEYPEADAALRKALECDPRLRNAQEMLDAVQRRNR